MAIAVNDIPSYLTISAQLVNEAPSEELNQLTNLAIKTNITFDEYKDKINNLNDILKEIDRNNIPQELVTIFELCNNFLANNYKVINIEDRNINEWRQQWEEKIKNKAINIQNILEASSRLINSLSSKINTLENLIRMVDKAPRKELDDLDKEISETVNDLDIDQLTEDLSRQAQKI